jgi:hypothetical protein
MSFCQDYDDDQLVDVIHYALTIINESNKSINCAYDVHNKKQRTAMPNKDVQSTAVENALKYLKKYAGLYTLKQDSPEAFKLVAWIGVELHELSDKSMHTSVVVHALHHVLKTTGKEFAPQFLSKISAMIAKNNGSNDDFAIGKNGLYLTFKSASKAITVQ